MRLAGILTEKGARTGGNERWGLWLLTLARTASLAITRH